MVAEPPPADGRRRGVGACAGRCSSFGAASLRVLAAAVRCRECVLTGKPLPPELMIDWSAGY